MKNKNNNRYYLCNIVSDNLEELYALNISNLTLTELGEYGIAYADGNEKTLDDLNTDVYYEIEILIESHILDGIVEFTESVLDLGEYNHEHDYDTLVIDIANDMIKNYFIISKSDDDLHSVVKLEEFTSILNSIVDDLIDDSCQDVDEEDSDYVFDKETLDRIFEKMSISVTDFRKTIDGLVIGDNAQLTIHSSGGDSFDTYIFRENGAAHKSGIFILPEQVIATDCGLIYESSIVVFNQWCILQLVSGETLTAVISVKAIPDENEIDMNYRKVYAYQLELDDDSEELHIEQFTAEIIAKSFSVDRELKQKKDINPYNIFCGKNVDDVICSFDMT